ncbi:unnamed protein product [Lactuca virosa]|uniref:Uncharacterized protein n=1 Tax=Lactuca virosa TaxID=75947 RepID=A0AAU9MMT6_9ASTR|nr:unnamed protein product [Lactuca virosa]
MCNIPIFESALKSATTFSISRLNRSFISIQSAQWKTTSLKAKSVPFNRRPNLLNHWGQKDIVVLLEFKKRVPDVAAKRSAPDNEGSNGKIRHCCLLLLFLFLLLLLLCSFSCCCS